MCCLRRMQANSCCSWRINGRIDAKRLSVKNPVGAVAAAIVATDAVAMEEAAVTRCLIRAKGEMKVVVLMDHPKNVASIAANRAILPRNADPRRRWASLV
jgi:hypothetical protein